MLVFAFFPSCFNTIMTNDKYMIRPDFHVASTLAFVLNQLYIWFPVTCNCD